MKSITKRILVVFFLILFIKIIISAMIPAPMGYSDEYFYIKMAKSFYDSGEFLIHGNPIHHYPPLYSILLSPAYVFNDMQVVYFVMKVINAILSSLAIIPAFLLARLFLSEKKSLLFSILVAVLPISFMFSPLLMAENLCLPLFLFSVYFIYRSFSHTGYRYDILAGLFIALTFLSKAMGAALVFGVIIIFVYKMFRKHFYEIKKKLLMAAVFILVATPWLIWRCWLFGFSINGLLGHYTDEVLPTIEGKYMWMAIWFFLYISYLVLAGGIVLPLSSIIKRKKLLSFVIFALVFSVVLIAANHDTRSLSTDVVRPIGRYVDLALPLIFLLGMINIDSLRKEKWLNPKYIIFFMFLFLGIVFTRFQLFPINNMSLSWLGGIKYLFEYLVYSKTTFAYSYYLGSFIFVGIFLAVCAICFILLRKKLTLNKVLAFFTVFFLLLSLFNFGLMYYNSSRNWHNSDAMQLSLWFNDYDQGKSKVLFDKRDEGSIFGVSDPMIYEAYATGVSASVIGTFMNNHIRVGDVNEKENYDYIITKHELDLKLVKQFGPFLVYTKYLN